MSNEQGERLRRYGVEVVGQLRQWLVEEGLEKPLGDAGYNIRTEDVALERRGDDWMAVIRFRIVGKARRYGFVAIVAEASNPQALWYEPPEMSAETVLIILDEAILTRKHVKPDDEGVVWLR